jgi:4-hydroxybenzoate polyprenyltransferase
LGGACALGWHLAWQLTRFKPNDSDRLIMLFRSNRNAGLLPLLFFAAAALL